MPFEFFLIGRLHLGIHSDCLCILKKMQIFKKIKKANVYFFQRMATNFYLESVVGLGIGIQISSFDSKSVVF